MKIYPLLIACTLAITTNTIADKAKAHNQFNEVNISSDQELNVNYREIINSTKISASGVTITAGDLTDALTVSVITTNSTITLNGGDGANFSASISELNIGASGWSITMPELGNGLTILESKFSGSGTIVATNSIDSISASSVSNSGYTQTVDIDLRED